MSHIARIAHQQMPVLLAFVMLLFIATIVSAQTGGAGKTKPNIVLIYTDDVDCETVFGQFPKQDSATVKFKNLKMLAEQGTRFSNFHVTTPVCGPSRACLYSGQYAHHNQCKVNDPKIIYAQGFSGGFTTFDPQNELAIWMKNAGYTTAQVGKYLHSDFVPDIKNGIGWKDIIPRGWDYFRVSLGSKYFEFPYYTKSTNTVTHSTREYRTDWDVRNAIEVIDKHSASKSKRPLFLCWTPIAAHITGPGEPMAASRHKRLFLDSEIPEFQKRLNARVRNPIEEMSSVAVPDAHRINEVTRMYRDRLRATTSIDEGIGWLRLSLKKKGMLENTIFVFTSDHGFRFAQNKHFGKRWPYDRITRVPFIVSGRGVPKNRQCDTLLANIDIAPTLVKLAGGKTPPSCDGQSFSNLIYNPNQKPTFKRDGILIENWGNATSFGAVLPATYCSIRTHDKIYTEWASGGREFYDLKADPQQTINLYPDLEPAKQTEFAERMRQLRRTNSRPKFNKIFCSDRNPHNRLCGSLKPVDFSGFIESDAGTKSVEVEFQCKETNEYWNGKQWSAIPSRIPATLKQPNGLVSEWKFSLDTNAHVRLSETYPEARETRFSVIATDLKGRQTTSRDIREYTLAFADPETTIDSYNYDVKERRFTASGTAMGVKKVPFVRVALQHPDTKKFWNGNTWIKKYFHVPAELSQPEETGGEYSWSLSVPFPDAPSVILIARAYNEVNESDHSPAMEMCKLTESE